MKPINQSKLLYEIEKSEKRQWIDIQDYVKYKLSDALRIRWYFRMGYVLLLLVILAMATHIAFY